MAEGVQIAAGAGVDWDTLWLSLGLLVLAFALLLAEIFVVSFGLLLVASILCALASIYYAFVASDAVGWTLTLVVPILGALLARWGIARIRASRHLVPQSEITAEAGYHHLTDRIGVRSGAIGTMVTAARPSGRARFDGGECDVQARSGTLERGERVVVRGIDGPIVFVDPVTGDGPEQHGSEAK